MSAALGTEQRARARWRQVLIAGLAALSVAGIEPVSFVVFGQLAEAHARPKKNVRVHHARKHYKRKVARGRYRFAPSAALRRARARNIQSAQAKAAAAAARQAAAPILPVDQSGKPMTREQIREAVLAAPLETLRRLGRHIIVGYHVTSQLTDVIQRGAIGGVFVTARNVKSRNKDHLAKEIEALRTLAHQSGSEHFWIATDQEGGNVSRLSPPLPYQPSLLRLLSRLKPDEDRGNAVKAYAKAQAEALASVGVNVNFAPVADLPSATKPARDGTTRINIRALGTAADTVTDVASTYCATLLEMGVACTLKHFPGLGRVEGDTHARPVKLEASLEELEKSDWVPFRTVMSKSPAFLMVGHPQLAAIDAENPSSVSKAVIGDIVRDKWGFGGVVVTDDLAMGAIRQRKGGLPKAAVDALRSGVDLVLISVSGDGLYEALYALIEAEKDGTLPRAVLDASAKRLDEAAAREMAAREKRKAVEEARKAREKLLAEQAIKLPVRRSLDEATGKPSGGGSSGGSSKAGPNKKAPDGAGVPSNAALANQSKGQTPPVLKKETETARQ